MIKVIFVCLGNICRSPAAEGILMKIVEDNNLQDEIMIDSAGILDYHEGDCADNRMIAAAKKRGINLITLSRPFKQKDFIEFDYIITMDNYIRDCLVEMDEERKFKNKIYNMTWFCKGHDIQEVPDPYYGTEKDFNYVLDILEDACKNLFIILRKDLKKKNETNS